jgi:mRNA (guanine-N7-)-methyltransferase
LIYKKGFNEILTEEQSSRDFGPLLAKMGVVNAEGGSNMDEDQWEAASESLYFPDLGTLLILDLYMGFAFQKR